MKYCRQLTESHIVTHEFPLVLRNINLILIEEGCDVLDNSFSTCNKIVIDGDKLEELIAIKETRDQNKSMDLVFGIKNKSNSKFQFVELKLNCTTFHYLNKGDFLGKVLGTKQALGGNNFSTDYYIVFKNNVLEQAKRYLFRVNPRLNNQFKAVNVEGLFCKFF
jgi:hypothetical protein